MKCVVNLNKYVTVTFEKKSDGTFAISTVPEELVHIIHLTEENGKVYVSVHDDVYAITDLKRAHSYYLRAPYTTGEIREVFESVKKDIPVSSSEIQSFRDYAEEPRLFEENKGRKTVIQTELHTHFLEMLTGKEFLEILLRYTDVIPMLDGTIVGKLKKGQGSGVQLIDRSFLDCDKLASQLSIDINGQLSFDDLLEISFRRGNVIRTAIEQTALKGGISSSDERYEVLRAIIYIEILLKALSTLKSRGIKYVEFSYSTGRLITLMQEYYRNHQDEFDGIEFNILYSFSRNVHKTSKADANIEEFERLVDEGYVKGFDLMGEESGLTEADRDNINDSKSFVSIMSKVLKKMNGRKDMVLRIHAGENEKSRNNPLESLMIIDKIISVNGYTPPQIRIGHGLHFMEQMKDKEGKMYTYLNLLKKYHVIVEINATSNYTLSSTKKFSDIPYRWYVDNDIPIVLATDGAGMYLTDANQERLIALLFGGKATLKNVGKTEKSILSR